MRSRTQAECGGGGGPKREASAGWGALRWSAKAEGAGRVGSGLSGSAEGEAPSRSGRCGACHPKARCRDGSRGLLSPESEARGGLPKVESATHFKCNVIKKQPTYKMVTSSLRLAVAFGGSQIRVGSTESSAETVSLLRWFPIRYQLKRSIIGLLSLPCF